MNYKTYKINDKNSSFFQWCLDHQLFKEESNFNSRMKNIYTGKREFESITSIVAFDGKNPTAIILCENNFGLDKAFCFKNVNRKSSKKQYFDWDIINVGFISLYVKEEFRNKGIATDLIKKLELHILKEIKLSLDENTVVLFEAKEKAYKLANKNLEYSYVTECEHHNGNYQKELHYLTQAIIEKRSDDFAPMYDLPNRKKLQF